MLFLDTLFLGDGSCASCGDAVVCDGTLCSDPTAAKAVHLTWELDGLAVLADEALERLIWNLRTIPAVLGQ